MSAIFLWAFLVFLPQPCTCLSSKQTASGVSIQADGNIGIAKPSLMRRDPSHAFVIDSSAEFKNAEHRVLGSHAYSNNSRAAHYGKHSLLLKTCDKVKRRKMKKHIQQCPIVEDAMKEEEDTTNGCFSLHLVCDPVHAKHILRLFPDEAVLISENWGIVDWTEHPAEAYEAGDAFYHKYRTYDAMVQKYNEILADLGSRGFQVLSDEVGPPTKVRGEKLKRVRIRGTGFQENQNHPRIVLRCQAHSREWITGMVCLRIIEVLGAQEKEEWMAKTEVVILPFANPDGIVHSQKWETREHDRWWRKNRNTDDCKEEEDYWTWDQNNGKTYQDYGGVDLNRNFEPWEHEGEVWTERALNPCEIQIYRGKNMMSEPEIIATKTAMLEGGMPTIVSDTHAYGTIIFGTARLEDSCTHGGPECRWTNEDEEHLLSRVLEKVNAKSTSWNEMSATYTWQPSTTMGTIKDYAISVGAIGFTVELRPSDWHGGGFGPDPNIDGGKMILNTFEEYFEGIKEMVAFAKEKLVPPSTTLPFVCGPGPDAGEWSSTDGYNYCRDNTKCPCGPCCYCKCQVTSGGELPPPEPVNPATTSQAFTLSSKHNADQEFTDHLWVPKDDFENMGNVCDTVDCLKDHEFWLSKADGTQVTGPYRVIHSNPNDGEWQGLKLYFISGNKRFEEQYKVGDALYLQNPATITRDD